MRIMTTKKYNELNETIEAYVRLADKHIKKITTLEAKIDELNKQLLYQKTYNTVFRQKLDEVIYPNTDERGLGDSRPTNSEEPDYSDF